MAKSKDIRTADVEEDKKCSLPESIVKVAGLCIEALKDPILQAIIIAEVIVLAGLIVAGAAVWESYVSGANAPQNQVGATEVASGPVVIPVIATPTFPPTATLLPTITPFPPTMTATTIPPSPTIAPQTSRTSTPSRTATSRPIEAPTKAPIDGVLEITDDTMIKDFHLDPGQSLIRKFVVYTGATRLIFTPSGVRPSNDTMKIYNPEQVRAIQSGAANITPVGRGNDCPKAEQGKHPNCMIYQGGHWAYEPSKNIWWVLITAGSTPIDGSLQLNSFGASGYRGEGGCFPIIETLPNMAPGSKPITWIRCPGASGHIIPDYTDELSVMAARITSKSGAGTLNSISPNQSTIESWRKDQIATSQPWKS